MKTIKLNIYLSVFSLLLICLTSCEIAKELDDFTQPNVLPAEAAIRDQASSELALTGTYSTLQSTSFYGPFLTLIPEIMGYTTVIDPSNNSPSNTGFVTNQPMQTSSEILDRYSSLYNQVNLSNWVIEKVSELSDDKFNEGRRMEIVAEAKAIRALGHFNLLRLWGQFYDVNSSYGIDVRLTPSRNDQAFPRKTVAESYDAIIRDLDDVIASAPDLRDGHKYFVNKTFGKALKAKVLLYMGDYSAAAALSLDVITNSGPNFTLTSTYSELFDHSTVATLDNTEAIFDIYHDAAESSYFGFMYGLYYNVSSDFVTYGTTGSMDVGGQNIAYDDGRISSLVGVFGENTKYANFYTREIYDTTYVLRMAEMYLIFAEADARASNTVSTAALNALNAIRIRAGATTTGGDGFETYPASISLDQFLEGVRIEKAMELATETGETWFDLIRYDFADGFGTGFLVSDLKPTATNPNNFILPIPFNSIDLNGDIIDQNPGY